MELWRHMTTANISIRGFGRSRLPVRGNLLWILPWFWTLKGKSDDNLVHFVQVSDIHISTHHEEQRTKEFHIFCSETLKLINPEVVVITGDLTDAKSANKLDSVQYQSEWDDFIAGIEQVDTKGIGFDDFTCSVGPWNFVNYQGNTLRKS